MITTKNDGVIIVLTTKLVEGGYVHILSTMENGKSWFTMTLFTMT